MNDAVGMVAAGAGMRWSGCGGFGSGVGSGGGVFASGGGSFRGGGSTGGSVVWDPSVTGHACARLDDATDEVRGGLRALRGAPDLTAAAALSGTADLRVCADDLQLRIASAQTLVAELERLHDDTVLVGRAYELASDHVLALVESLAGSAAYATGAGARVLAVAVLGALLPASPVLLAVGVSAALTVGLVVVPLAARIALMHPQPAARMLALGGASTDRLLERASAFWVGAGEALMAQPAFVSALALVLESSDELLAGFFGVPLGTADAIEATVGDHEVMALMAAAAATGTGFVAGNPRPVRVDRRTPVTPPARPVTDAASAMRVIRDQPDEVTIHEHRLPDGTRRFQVFVSGTTVGTGLDVQANLENASSTPDALRGSDAAVAQAMRDAGIGPGDAVDLFGYSQGAAAAANIAATGEFDVETALLVGGPVAGTELPRDVAVYSIAHEGDPIAALDGLSDGDGVHVTVVESAADLGDGPLARHSSAEYVATLEQEPDFMRDAYATRLSAGAAGGVGVAGTSVRLRR